MSDEKPAILGGTPVRTEPFPPRPLVRPQAIEAVVEILKKGHLSHFYKNPRGGETIQKFEEEVAKYHGMQYAISVNSGTAALHTALEAAEVKQYSRVLVPAYTFTATATAVLMRGAIPTLIDVDLKDGNINVDQIKAAIRNFGQQISAIIPVHIMGTPANMDEIMAIADKYKLIVIEDCAQAAGASYKGKKVGTFGNAGCFDGRSKVITEEGRVSIAKIRTGDKVLTEKGFQKVLEIHNRLYNGEWTVIYFGRKAKVTQIKATSEHPVKVWRNNQDQWLQISEIRKGDMIYVTTHYCEQCANELIPYYLKLCHKCYPSQSQNARNIQVALHDKGVTPQSHSRIHETGKHFREDIIPTAKRFEEDGYRVIPIGAVLPDIIAMKDNKVFAVEVENKVTPRQSKLIKYDSVRQYYDDVIWITKQPKPKWSTRKYEIIGNLARVPIVLVKQWRKLYTRSVWNLTIENSPTYFYTPPTGSTSISQQVIGGALVHNCFSMQETKPVAAGEGGFILTNDQKLAGQAMLIRNHGEIYGNDGEGALLIGRNYRLIEYVAAVALDAFKQIDYINDQNRANAAIINDAIKKVRFLEPLVVSEGSHATYSRFPFRINPTIFYDVAGSVNDPWKGHARAVFLQALKAEGIEMNGGYKKALFEYPLFRNIFYSNMPGIAALMMANMNEQITTAQQLVYPNTLTLVHQQAIWFADHLYPTTQKDARDIAKAILKVSTHIKEIATAIGGKVNV